MTPKPKKGAPKFSRPQRPRDWRTLTWYLLLLFIIVSFATASLTDPKDPKSIDFSAFTAALNKGQVQEVTIRSSDRMIVGKLSDGTQFKTYFLEYPNLIQELRDQNVNVKVNPADSNWFWNLFLQAFLPFILIAGLWFFIFRQAQGANNQAMSFGKSRAKPWDKDAHKDRVTFKNVAGIDEALEELREIVDFLKKPEKYRKLGAKIPKGVLLMGSPGTGKTLLARAIAGEADVPFFNLSGSDFVEMFVGVGASRVRDLFAQAKKGAPSIIFIDEIDAVGRHRGAGLGGGHDEREQTLNQLLVEMDGFDAETTVIIIAATNRPDILDPALLRPGRFDRQVTVDKPDIKGRTDILKIHAKGKKLAKDVDMDVLAKQTPGFTGADLANLMNEAALLAARRSKRSIGLDELEESVERIMAGPSRKSRVMSKKEKDTIAYHEVGHAIVAATIDHVDGVHKITILPRGMALGYTMQLPAEDKYLISRSEILGRIKVLLGGRVAEEEFFNEITSGASNDIERATDLARQYICTYGMSDKLGLRKYGKTEGNVFLGKQYSDHSKDYSEATAREIDEEIHDIIEDAHAEVTKIIKKYKKDIEKVVQVLLEKETMEGEEFLELIGKKKTPKQADKKVA